MKKIFEILYTEANRYKSWVKYASIFKKFRGYSMISLRFFIANLEIAKKYSSTSGAIVECGTWKGGMIAGIADILGKDKEYFLFDSFEGLPEVKDIDGESAIKWQANKDSKYYFDNCTASEQDALSAMKIAGIKNPKIIKGWFNHTLPNINIEKGISILRMDGDWYDSTMDILKNLFYKVNKGGVIIIDDYHTWDGCSKAIHDFLSANKCIERISSHDGVCYIEKR